MFSRPVDGPQLKLRAASRVAVLTALLSALPAYAGCGWGGRSLSGAAEFVILGGLTCLTLAFALLTRAGPGGRVLVIFSSVTALLAVLLGGVFAVINESASLAVYWGGGAIGFAILGWYRFMTLNGPIRYPQVLVQPPPQDQQLL
ncbi:hypothetical protein MYSTI_07531 [Myxococcus stipitatus DSM 14675]|uniref:Uncharacterized protein n=1 Tax=Myxococcus stipitatus (strain DSM 14675 / JCM 12634 / Mx s8) TaxID=1278073 RepID=L7ULB2_MYXSD|nr:hypothetical protein [Myxococcus stipitatus]AGC48803.1 hypothetical protein MYSTI_07531 [Myxococcus stipitatus DSM 14675]